MIKKEIKHFIYCDNPDCEGKDNPISMGDLELTAINRATQAGHFIEPTRGITICRYCAGSIIQEHLKRRAEKE